MARVWKLGSWPGIGRNTRKNRSKYIEKAREKGFVAIGYSWLGNLARKSVEDFQNEGESPKTAKQLYAFANEISQGDIVLLYDNRVKPHIVYAGEVGQPPSDLAPSSGSSGAYYHVPHGHPSLDYFPGKSNAPDRLSVRWLTLSGKTSFAAELPWRDTVHEVERVHLETANGMFKWIRDPILKSFLKRKISESRPKGSRTESKAGIPEDNRYRPRWVFQAREFKGGQKYYPLYEELPRILRRSPSKRVVHWNSAEHRYTPFLMREGDLVLLFQGATKSDSTRGFYGSAVITNLNGRCMAPRGEGGSHHERNDHNRAIGVDLKYLTQFHRHMILRIQPNSPLGNKNLQKLIAGGRKGSAQDSVFGITDEDWVRISRYFDSVLRSDARERGRGRTGRKRSQGWTPIDSERKAKIEKSAIRSTRDSFENEGYKVTSVEEDNKGWDLDAWKNEIVLHLEVKGLSGSDVSIELTPNEYRHVRDRSSDYRICVVTEALQNPSLRVFSYSERSRRWEDELGNGLRAQEMTAARMSLP